MKIGIIGYGVVGSALARFFAKKGRHEVLVYDKFLREFSGAGRLDAMDGCDVVFVAVPTPYDSERQACDIDAVAEIVRWVAAPLCIKSTVPPGAIDRLVASTGKRIAYSPEYLGESPDHPWREVDACGFVVLAGNELACALVREAYESSARFRLQYVRTDLRAAELAKYMENCFLATKVAFANQFFELAAASGIDYDAVRAIVALDPRIGASHTAVTEDRGFGGKCLPKDLCSLIAWAGGSSAAPFLQNVVEYNDTVRRAVALS